MSIPADFRRVLETGDPAWSQGLPMHCQIVYGDNLDGRIRVYTAVEYAKVVERIQNMSDSDSNKDPIIHLMVTQSEPLVVDKDGRAVLALKHREKLDITEGMLSFRGRITHFEIWRNDNYKAKVKAPIEEFLADKSENFDPLSLVGP
jgi:MraZ protein